jgi:hypothetical protein
VPAVGGQGRSPWLLYGLAALGPVALVAVLLVLFVGGNGSSTKNVTGSAPKIDYATLPGLQKGKAPWPPEYASLPDRLAPLQLSSLGVQGTTLHIHQHLDIFVNGKHETVPVGIGIYGNQFITELHTHSAAPEGLPGPPGRPTGVIHVESPTNTTYTLGQFIGVWGVRFTPDCIGGYCKQLIPWRVYVNGKLYTGDPRAIPLKEHDEYAIVIGTPPAKIPSSFAWGAGL